MHLSDRFNEKHSCIYIYIKVAADYNRLLLYNRREKAKIILGVDVLMRDSCLFHFSHFELDL